MAVVSVTGQFDISGQLNPHSFTFLNLWGAELTAASGMASGDAMIWNDGAQQVTIAGGLLDGNKSELAGNSNSGIRIDGGDEPAYVNEYRNRVLYTQIRNFDRIGLTGSSRRALYLGVSSFNNDEHGFVATSSDQIWFDCHAEENGVRSFYVITSFNHFYRPVAEDSATGFRFRDGADYNLIQGGYTEYCDGAGIEFQSGATFNKVRDQIFINNGQTEQAPAIVVSDDRTKIFDNTFYDDQDSPTQDGAVIVESTANYTNIRGNDWCDNPLGGVTDNGTNTQIGGVGKEAAGPGDSPTAANWQAGDVVENTIDATVWRLKTDGSSWFQIS